MTAAHVPLAAIDISNWVSLGIALALIAYLVFALLRPERF